MKKKNPKKNHLTGGMRCPFFFFFIVSTAGYYISYIAVPRLSDSLISVINVSWKFCEKLFIGTKSENRRAFLTEATVYTLSIQTDRTEQYRSWLDAMDVASDKGLHCFHSFVNESIWNNLKIAYLGRGDLGKGRAIRSISPDCCLLNLPRDFISLLVDFWVQLFKASLA